MQSLTKMKKKKKKKNNEDSYFLFRCIDNGVGMRVVVDVAFEHSSLLASLGFSVLGLLFVIVG